MANSKRRKILQTLSFHNAIVEEISSIFPSSKDARGRAVQCARMIRRVKCPKNRNDVRDGLETLLRDFRKCEIKGRKLSRTDIAEFLGALEALDLQDAEEARNRIASRLQDAPA